MFQTMAEVCSLIYQVTSKLINFPWVITYHPTKQKLKESNQSQLFELSVNRQTRKHSLLAGGNNS